MVGVPDKKLGKASNRGHAPQLEEKLSLRVHEIIQDCQNQNGLRHGDYEHYRQYCTRRLKRLRSLRSVRLSYGRGKTYVKRELTSDVVTTHSHLEVVLMMAERAWSHSVKRKQETAGGPYRMRRHAVVRLAKAVKWACDLEGLCHATADERTCLEATAYSSWMSGNLSLERGEWREGLERFSMAHHICEELGKLGLPEDEDLFKRRVEEIEPLMRYCRYKLDPSEGPPEEGREESSSGATAVASKLESIAAESLMTRGGSPEIIEWRGKTVSVRSEALGSTVLKADALAKRLFTSAKTSKRAARRGKKAAVDHPEDSKVEVEPAPGRYLKVLGAYDDALLKVAQEMSKLQGKRGGVKVEGRRSELEVLRCYATHRKLGLLVRRNERIARELQEKRSSGGGSKKGAGDEGKLDRATAAADVVQAYDALLQSVKAMIVNLGGAEDAADDPEDDEDGLMENARADEARFRALRCYYVMEALAAGEKWGEAAALMGHTKSLCQEAKDMLRDDDPRIGGLVKLEAMLEGALHRSVAHALLLKAKREASFSAGMNGVSISDDLGPSGGVSGEGPVQARQRPRTGRPFKDLLKEFDGRGSGMEAGEGKEEYGITDFPPSLTLVPCKPRLLDLAFDYLDFPDLDERAGIEKTVESVPDQGGQGDGGSGITGLVGWAFGWK